MSTTPPDNTGYVWLSIKKSDLLSHRPVGRRRLHLITTRSETIWVQCSTSWVLKLQHKVTITLLKFQLKRDNKNLTLLCKTKQFPFSCQQSTTTFQSILMDARTKFNLKYLNLLLIDSIREWTSTQEASDHHFNRVFYLIVILTIKTFQQQFKFHALLEYTQKLQYRKDQKLQYIPQNVL